MSRELARRGHDVAHSFLARERTQKGLLERRPGDPASLVFMPIRRGSDSSRRGMARRIRHEVLYGRRLVRAAAAYRPDVVISANTPLAAQWQLMTWSHRSGTGFVYWMQDLISVAVRQHVRRRFAWIELPVARLARWLERSSLVGADGVVAVTPAFRGPLAKYRVRAENIAVIPNWAPLDDIVPVERRNPWAMDHGLADDLVFLYAGALGSKHDPTLLIQLAQTLPVTVVVVSESFGVAAVKAQAARLGLDNIRVVPVQPYEQLSQVLGSADVLVATLDRKGSAHSVPSKVLSYLCAERPILALIARENLAAAVVTESGGGIVVEPDDVPGALAAARELAQNETQRHELARRGRAYAERTFDIQRIGDEFEAVLARASAAGHGRAKSHGLRAW